MIARRSWLGIDSADDRIKSETPQTLGSRIRVPVWLGPPHALGARPTSPTGLRQVHAVPRPLDKWRRTLDERAVATRRLAPDEARVPGRATTVRGGGIHVDAA
jgi:hypothetical protein